MQVLFLHLLGQLEIEERVAEFGLTEDGREFLGRQSGRRMHYRVDIAYSGHRRRGLFLAQTPGIDLSPIRIVQCHLVTPGYSVGASEYLAEPCGNELVS